MNKDGNKQTGLYSLHEVLMLQALRLLLLTNPSLHRTLSLTNCPARYWYYSYRCQTEISQLRHDRTLWVNHP